MEFHSKRAARARKRVAASAGAVATAAALALGSGAALPAPSSAAAAPPAESPGCATYGCVYEHCTSRHTRQGTGGRTCEHVVSDEALPDGGPHNRRFVEVRWPGRYDPARRQMWDQVAYCESTWRWSYAGTYHGGLQFTASTWAAFGGHEYSRYAHQALPEQQIDIAERVAFHGHGGNPPQGPGAWPRCGRSLRAP
jgi:resuscitation-promoting factor RpfA